NPHPRKTRRQQRSKKSKKRTNQQPQLPNSPPLLMTTRQPRLPKLTKVTSVLTTTTTNKTVVGAAAGPTTAKRKTTRAAHTLTRAHFNERLLRCSEQCGHQQRHRGQRTGQHQVGGRRAWPG